MTHKSTTKAANLHHDFAPGCCDHPKWLHHSDHCATCGKPAYIPDWIVADRIARALSSFWVRRAL